MANDRLYIVNKETRQYVCVAKSFGDGWRLGNVEVLKKLLEETSDLSNKDEIVIGRESDDKFYEEHIANSDNLNKEGSWVYA